MLKGFESCSRAARELREDLQMLSSSSLALSLASSLAFALAFALVAMRAAALPLRALRARRFASLHRLSEDEEMLRSSAERFAREILAPHVAEMDRKAEMRKEIVSALFEQGLMGIEVPQEMGGVDMNFTAACLAIEEVAKVDPAVSALMDRIELEPPCSNDIFTCYK